MARDLGFNFGCKIVRGAYMDYERERSNSLGTECPILDSYEETNGSYDAVVGSVLENVRYSDYRKILDQIRHAD